MGEPLLGVPHGTTHGCCKVWCNVARSPMGVSFPRGTPTRSLTGDAAFDDTHETTHGVLKFFGHSHEMPRGG